VFFNLEILREQIQNKVNQTLKAISTTWRQVVSSIQNMGHGSTLSLGKREESQRVKDFLRAGIEEMTVHTQRMYHLARCLQERDPVCTSVFQTVQEVDAWQSGSTQQQTQAASIANIFNLFSEKLFHIIKQTLQKMNQNPASYTFALQTLSQTHYKFFVKDCLYDKLYLQGILNHIDQSAIGDRTSIVCQLKYPMLDSVEVLKERYVQNKFGKKQSEQ